MLLNIKFEKCLEKIKTPPKLEKNKYLENGNYPVISQEASLINGYYNDFEMLFKVEKPVIVFGDHTRVLKYIDFDFITGADGVKIIQPIDDINPRFFYYLLQLKMPDSLGYARHYRLLKEIDFTIPSLSKQQDVVTKLDLAFLQIDKAITFSDKQAIEANKLRYENIKNVMIDLGKEFGLATLNDISTIKPKKNIVFKSINASDEVSFLNMNGLGVEKKYTDPVTNKRLKEVYSSYQYFENNDVLFAKITPCFENGKLSIVRNLKNGIGFGSSEFVVLRPKSSIDSEFLYYALLDKSFRQQGKEQMSGAVGHKRVTKEYYYNYKVPVPKIEIQKKVVKNFDQIWNNLDIICHIKYKKRKELEDLKFSILSQEMGSFNK